MRINLDEYLEKETGFEIQLGGEVFNVPIPSTRTVIMATEIMKDAENGDNEIYEFLKVLKIIVGDKLYNAILDNVPFTSINSVLNTILSNALKTMTEKGLEVEGVVVDDENSGFILEGDDFKSIPR